MLRIIDRRRWLTAAAVSLVAGLGFGAYGAIAAATPTPTPAVTVKQPVVLYSSVLIGPVTVKHGFKAEIDTIGCNTRQATAILVYVKADGRAALVHSYAGPLSACTIARTLGTAALKAHWGDALELDAAVTAEGKLKRENLHVQGCSGTYIETRSAKLTGSANLTIHEKAFGRVDLAKARITDEALVSAGCSDDEGSGAGTVPLSGTATTSGFPVTPQSAASRAAAAWEAAATSTTSATPPTVTSDGSGTQFLAVFDDSEDLVITSQTDAPGDPLTIIADNATDDPAPDVEGGMGVLVETPRSFTATGGDATAQVSVDAPFAKGTLDFTANRACNDRTDALDGDLSGAIVVTDPVFGTLTYSGPAAIGAAVGNGDADMSSC